MVKCVPFGQPCCTPTVDKPHPYGVTVQDHGADPFAPWLLACSPRQGGNCDAVADSLCKGLSGQHTAGPTVTFLRDHPVAPCSSCGSCARQRLACPHLNMDASAPLFDALCKARTLVLVAPIYFYHVPAQLKALIDRSQPWWMARDIWKDPPFSQRNAHIILVGARPKGERLFEGALLSLRYWLDLFGYTLASPLTLNSLDRPEDFRNSPDHQALVADYAESIKTTLAGD